MPSAVWSVSSHHQLSTMRIAELTAGSGPLRFTMAADGETSPLIWKPSSCEVGLLQCERACFRFLHVNGIWTAWSWRYINHDSWR
jgi:hypothetical protein